MEIKIEGTSVLENGDVSVRLAIFGGANTEKKTFIVTPSDFRDMRIKCGRELSETEYDALEEAAAFRDALKKAVYLLSYRANSHAALERKLIRRGVTARVAVRTVDYLCERGYINESSDAEALVDSCLEKGYGSRRIILKLREGGYDEEVISSAYGKLSEVDFVHNCAAVIKKRCIRIPEDKESRDRIISAMVRYGYNFSEIRDAVRLIEKCFDTPASGSVLLREAYISK